MSIDPPSHAEPKRKRNTVRWIALGCGAVVFAGIVIAGATALLLRKATEGPETAVQQFLAAAAAGDYTAAHGHFSAPLADVQPLEAFSQAAAANPTFFSVTHTSFNSFSVDGSGAQLSGTVTLSSGTKVPAEFRLVQENDEWKLIAYEIGTIEE